MNLNELYNENKNPFQDVVDKVAAKEKQADAEHTKGLKDIADKFQSAEKKSSEEFSKKLRADEAKDTHCSDKCCGSDVKAEDCNCPPTCKHCDCNAIVSESQLPQQGVAEGSLDDIEDTRQFRNAIALAKSQKTIRQAKHGKNTKFYSDGTPVTPKETARRAAERKARKQGVAEGSLDDIEQFAADLAENGFDQDEIDSILSKLEEKKHVGTDGPDAAEPEEMGDTLSDGELDFIEKHSIEITDFRPEDPKHHEATKKATPPTTKGVGTAEVDGQKIVASKPEVAVKSQAPVPKTK